MISRETILARALTRRRPQFTDPSLMPTDSEGLLVDPRPAVSLGSLDGAAYAAGLGELADDSTDDAE
jgi:hypothetical protein